MPNIFTRFRNLFRVSPENPSTSLSNPAPWLSSLFGTKSSSGQEITPTSVISLPAIWRAIDILGSTIGSLPFEVISEGEDGNISIEKTHPVSKIINVAPSKHYTSFTYRHTSMLHAVLFGDWISLIVRDTQSNYPKRLVILDPDKVEIRTTKDDIFYKISEGEYKGEYPSEDIIHIPNLSFNGIKGLNVMRVMADTFGMGLSSREYVNTYHKSGSMIAGVIETDQTLTDIQYQNLKQSFQLEYGGVTGSGKTPLLEGGAKYKQINANLSDSRTIDTMKFNLNDIARITGIPPHMLADLERSTNNNIEQQSLELAQYTIRPWVKRIEQEYNRKIFRSNEIGKYKVRLNMDAMLRGDTETRANLYRTLWGIGAISINEIRTREKLNPVAGGDARYIPLNTSPVDDNGNQLFAPKSAEVSDKNE
jgi:HK97 family phage portal protein